MRNAAEKPANYEKELHFATPPINPAEMVIVASSWFAPRNKRRLALALRCLVFSAAFSSAAQVPPAGSVKFDGSLGGRSDALPGPGYVIPADAGAQRGGNLFHSFEQFDLGVGDSATFQGPGTFTNILARVTGPAASSIDGMIRSEIPGANVFLINPHGLIFGPHARLEIGGSFVASTADYVKLADGGRFDARTTTSDVLTSAPVSAFGFAGKPAPVSFSGSELTAAGLHVIGGDVQLVGARLIATSDAISVLSLAHGGDVPFSLAAPGAGYRTLAGGAFGRLSLKTIPAKTDGASLAKPSTITAVGGKVVIRAGVLQLASASTIRSTNDSDLQRGGDIFITAETLSLSGFGTKIESATGGTGRGGAIDLVAHDLTVSGASAIASQTSGTAQGGDIHLEVAGRLSVTTHGSISADTYDAGPAGSVSVAAGELQITGDDSRIFTGIRSAVAPESDPANALFATGRGGDVSIRTGSAFVSAGGAISTATYGPGNAGGIELAVSGDLTVAHQGLITASTQSRGAGGSMRVQAERLLIDGSGPEDRAFTGLSAQSLGGRNGPGGSIDVQVGRLTMLGGAVIEASTGGVSAAGSVKVTADSILLDGRGAQIQKNVGLPLATAISARTVAGATGRGGDVTVTARDSITLVNRGEIEAATEGRGAGGNVTVRAGRLTASGTSFGYPSGVIARGAAGATGAAGSVRVEVADAVTLSDGAAIASNHLGSGVAGSVRVTAGREIALTDAATITVASRAAAAGTVAVESGGKITLEGGSDITASAGGSGGNVFLQARDLLYLSDSRIVAEAGSVRSASGATGSGGNIFIDPEFVILDHSTISANAAAGRGGNILLQAENFLPNSTPITATGDTAGTVEIAAPELDLNAALAALAASFVDASLRLQERCVMRLGVEASSFLAVGRGGVEVSPEDVPVKTVARVRRPAMGRVTTQ